MCSNYVLRARSERPLKNNSTDGGCKNAWSTKSMIAHKTSWRWETWSIACFLYAVCLFVCLFFNGRFTEPMSTNLNELLTFSLSVLLVFFTVGLCNDEKSNQVVDFSSKTFICWDHSHVFSFYRVASFLHVYAILFLFTSRFSCDKLNFNSSTAGYGNFTFRMDFFKSGSFVVPYTAADYPLQLRLNDYIYVRYSVESSAELVIMAENCRATKDGSFYSLPQYNIIQNG